MPSNDATKLAGLRPLVGFFSYSRLDDADFNAALSKIREGIRAQLSARLGLTHSDFELFQDVSAIPPGAQWERAIKTAIAKSVFFIPIITPRAINSDYIKKELEWFQIREQEELRRDDLVFPIIFIEIPKDEWRQNEVLKVLRSRQYVDWSNLNDGQFQDAVRDFCRGIIRVLHRPQPEPVRQSVAPLASVTASVPSTGLDRPLPHLEPEWPERVKERLRPLKRWIEFCRGWVLSVVVLVPLVAAAAISLSIALHNGRSPPPVAQPPIPHPPGVQPPVPQSPPSTSVHVTVLSLEDERNLKPGSVFKECERCPEMVAALTGSLSMGSPVSEPGRNSIEGPQHTVTFARRFAVGRFPVTFDEWEACTTDGGCNGYIPSDLGWGRDRRPVVNLSWEDANAYVAWLSNATKKKYRLLTEAEREYVTRAGTTTPFWWGSSISIQQANYDGRYSYSNGPKGEYRTKTVPVKTFDPNPWGIYEVHGNVWDWVEDCYEANSRSYQGAPNDGSAYTWKECTLRVVRGGSWYDSPNKLRSASRWAYTPSTRLNILGIRVARTLLP